VLGLAGCGSSGPPAPEPASTAAPTPAAAPAGTGGTDAGDLHIRGAYIPQQASASEAAAYFTVTNSADTPDTLTAVTTPAAPMVTLHTTVTRGGTGTMEMLSQLAIPAHGTAALTVGHDHLMLMNPVQRLTQGQRVILTLTFARAGQVELAVPVVGYTGPAGGPSSSGGVDGEGAPAEDGGAMPGMTMPAGQYMTMPAGQ
jgi:copper(I)-binding protein